GVYAKRGAADAAPRLLTTPTADFAVSPGFRDFYLDFATFPVDFQPVCSNFCLSRQFRGNRCAASDLSPPTRQWADGERKRAALSPAGTARRSALSFAMGLAMGRTMSCKERTRPSGHDNGSESRQPRARSPNHG